MIQELIILFSFLIVISYILNVISEKIKIPPVIFLLAIGMFMRFLAIHFRLNLPDLVPYLKFVGGISLILVVLQGSMELRWSSEKNKLIVRMFILCIAPMLIMGFLGAWILTLIYHCSFHLALCNVIPFTIISSAIAIPAVKILTLRSREEITYESSFSDIVGILFFDFVIGEHGDVLAETGIFILQLGGTILLTILATIVIAWLLGFLPPGIRFIPILANLVLVFEVAEFFHLPGLIFIFVFGLFLGNLSRFAKMKHMRKIKPEHIRANFDQFYSIVTETNFLVRSFFFLLLGFFTNPLTLFSPKGLLWAGCILAIIYGIRVLSLRILHVRLMPNLFYAPRGLVSILLLMYIPANQLLPSISMNLVIQVVILTTVVMAIGSILGSKEKTEEEKERTAVKPSRITSSEAKENRADKGE